MTASTLVFGGTGGIGQAVVRRFAGTGDSVCFTYLRAEESAQRLVAEMVRQGHDVSCQQLDARDDAATRAIVQSCGDPLHTVVFAVASGVHRPLEDVKPKHVDWTFDVSARSFLLLFGHVLGPLARNGGTITTLSSVGSRRVLPNYALVGMAKAAMEATVRYAAVEAAPRGVRVNCVCAGVVDTKAIESFPDRGERLRAASARTPMGRLVTPEEVAAAIAWLASPEAAMVTGHNLVVDGGFELPEMLGSDGFD